jgi:hypothetical protein
LGNTFNDSGIFHLQYCLTSIHVLIIILR